MRRSSTHLLLLVCALLAVTIAPAYSWQPNAAYYGAGRRVALSSLRTLTFYSGKHTAYRRTSPLPHLTCIGSPCRRFQPDVVQCTAMGDGQWKCSADLPVTIRMGRVEVSCEGYDYAEDPYVLKDSCALEYTLLPSGIGREGGWDGYGGRKGGGWGERLVEGVFWVVFWGVLAMIVVNFVKAIRGNAGAATAGRTGRGGGGGGGGGGGWWPGGANPPPPPYTPKPEPDSSTSSSWRPGFWTGLGLGGLAASAAASSSRRRQQPSFFNPDPYGGYDGNFAAGPSSHFGGRRRGWDDSDRGSSSAFRESTGFGGTRNR